MEPGSLGEINKWLLIYFRWYICSKYN